MGWWLDDNSNLIGDGALDLTDQYLNQISAEYSLEVGRKPTLDEVLTTLKMILGPRIDEFSSNDSSEILVALQAKMKKGKEKQKPRPGDVFCIPLDGSTFGFGRVTPQASVYEYFDFVSPKKTAILSKVDREELIPFEYMTLSYGLDNGDWPTIGNVPFRGDYPLKSFRMGKRVTVGTDLVAGFIDVFTETIYAPEQAELLPEMEMWPPKFVVRFLTKWFSDKGIAKLNLPD